MAKKLKHEARARHIQHVFTTLSLPLDSTTTSPSLWPTKAHAEERSGNGGGGRPHVAGLLQRAHGTYAPPILLRLRAMILFPLI
jgi:hypothetical protein